MTLVVTYLLWVSCSACMSSGTGVAPVTLMEHYCVPLILFNFWFSVRTDLFMGFTHFFYIGFPRFDFYLRSYCPREFCGAGAVGCYYFLETLFFRKSFNTQL
jgi:hypothetical protein